MLDICMLKYETRRRMNVSMLSLNHWMKTQQKTTSVTAYNLKILFHYLNSLVLNQN